MKCCTNTIFKTISLPFEDTFHNRRKKSDGLNLLSTLAIFHLLAVSSNALSVYFKAIQVGDFWRLA